jgi:hypothetical protein
VSEPTADSCGRDLGLFWLVLPTLFFRLLLQVAALASWILLQSRISIAAKHAGCRYDKLYSVPALVGKVWVLSDGEPRPGTGLLSLACPRGWATAH